MSTYIQLLPDFRSRDLSPGLAAKLADPLWLLTRQWQVGEFCGEDAASAAWVEWETEAVPMDTVGVGKVGRGLPAAPTEVVVEQENVWKSPGKLRISLEIAALLLRLLEEKGASSLKESLVSHPALRPSLAGVEAAALPRLKLLARRSFDGYALFEALTTQDGLRLADPTVVTLRSLIEKSAAKTRGFVRSWVESVQALVESSELGAWRADRQEYNFRMATQAAEGEVGLEAGEYRGGRLDWEAFDMGTAPKELRGGKTAPKVVKSRGAVLPASVRYSGMPASRWWEFENGRVHFGGLEAQPEDLIRLVMAEFATTFGDDWLVMPVRLGVGALNRVTKVKVLDNFGGSLEPKAMALRDVAINPTRNWRYFEMNGDSSVAAGRCPWLFLPATLSERQEGIPIEEVLFLRDEAANLGWAVERRLEGKDGIGRPRPVPALRELPNPGGWTYTVAGDVPAGWIPLLPQIIGSGPEIELRRARLSGWKEEDFPRALVLNPTEKLVMKEEAVPTGGMLVTRSWQRARGADGRVYVWIGREKRPGMGEQGSGWEVDRLRVG